MTQRLLLPFIVLLLFLAQLQLVTHLRDEDSTWITPPAEKHHRWSPTLFRVLTFGHLPAAIDWLLIRVLIDPAYAHIAPGIHPPIFYDLDLATDLDPAFFELYTMGANLLSVVRNDGPGAHTILSKGEHFKKQQLSHWPLAFQSRYWQQSWYLSMLLGYVCLFDLEDLPSAAQAFEEAGKDSLAPRYLQQLASRFRKPGGIYEVGLRILNLMIDREKQEKTKLQLIKKRDSLFLGQFLFQVNQSFREFLSKQNDYKNKLLVARDQLLSYWNKFRKTNALDRDPLGGRLSLDPLGRIRSDTPHEKVLGLE